MGVVVSMISFSALLLFCSFAVWGDMLLGVVVARFSGVKYLVSAGE